MTRLTPMAAIVAAAVGGGCSLIASTDDICNPANNPRACGGNDGGGGDGGGDGGGGDGGGGNRHLRVQTARGRVRSQDQHIDCPGNCDSDYPDGTTVPLSVEAQGNTFTGWSGTGTCDGTTNTNCNVVMNQDRTVLARWSGMFLVNVTIDGPGGHVESTPSGIACNVGAPGTNVCTAEFAAGSTVTLTAAPTATTVFQGWGGGGCSGGSGPCAFTVTADTFVHAVFAASAQTHTLTVSLGGGGRGVLNAVEGGVTRSCVGPSGTQCNWTYPSTSTVVLTAVPDSGMSIMGWTGVCSAATNDQCTVPMNQDQSVSVSFVPSGGNFRLTVDPKPLDGTIRSNNDNDVADGKINCGSEGNQCQFDYSPGANIHLVAVPDTDATLLGWGGVCLGRGSDRCDLNAGSNMTVSATFDGPKSLTISKQGPGRGTVATNPTGITCTPDCATASARFNTGSTVRLTATPEAGSVLGTPTFSSNCSNVGAGLCDTVMSADKEVTVNFTKQYTLTVNATAGGKVISPGNGIDCTGLCPYTFEHGQSIVLTASADNDDAFTVWTGCDKSGDVAVGIQCSITLTEDRTIKANFVPAYTLTVVRAGHGVGRAVSTPSGIDCGTDCTERLPAGTSVALDALPGSGSRLAVFSGACSGTTNCFLAMDGDKKVVVAFDRNDNSAPPCPTTPVSEVCNGCDDDLDGEVDEGMDGQEQTGMQGDKPISLSGWRNGFGLGAWPNLYSYVPDGVKGLDASGGPPADGRRYVAVAAYEQTAGQEILFAVWRAGSSELRYNKLPQVSSTFSYASPPSPSVTGTDAFDDVGNFAVAAAFGGDVLAAWEGNDTEQPPNRAVRYFTKLGSDSTTTLSSTSLIAARGKEPDVAVTGATTSPVATCFALVWLHLTAATPRVLIHAVNSSLGVVGGSALIKDEAGGPALSKPQVAFNFNEIGIVWQEGTTTPKIKFARANKTDSASACGDPALVANSEREVADGQDPDLTAAPGGTWIVGYQNLGANKAFVQWLTTTGDKLGPAVDVGAPAATPPAIAFTSTLGVAYDAGGSPRFKRMCPAPAPPPSQP